MVGGENYSFLNILCSFWLEDVGNLLRREEVFTELCHSRTATLMYGMWWGSAWPCLQALDSAFARWGTPPLLAADVVFLFTNLVSK